jgi:hypothetical protein
MAKQSGLGDNFYVSGYDLSGDVTALDSISGPSTVLDGVTGIDKSAMERLLGLRSGHMEVSTWFNDAVGHEHPVLAALPTTDQLGCYFRGTVRGGPTAALVGKELDHAVTRAVDGSLTAKTVLDSNSYGLEWGNSLTAGKQVDSVAGNGTSIDLTTVSLAFGWQAYLQVFALTGTNVIITIQDSADNGTFANLTGGAFTSVTAAPAWQRLEGGRTATTRRYWRIVSSGTFSSATFAVVFVRNDTAVAF